MTPDKDENLLDETEIHAEGAGAEAWQDDQPPEDDFKDGEEPVEAIEETSEKEDAPKAKKRGTVMLLGVLVVVAAAVGGLMYMQFGGGLSSAPAPEPVAQAAPPAIPPAPVGQIGRSVDMPVSETGASAQIASLDGPGTRSVGDALPASPSSATVSPDMASTMPLPAAPQQPSPSVVPPSAATMPSLAPAAGDSGVDAVRTEFQQKTVAMNEQIEAVRATLAQLSDKVDQMARRVDTQQPMAALQAAAQPSPEIEGRLAALEQKIKDMAKAPVVVHEVRGPEALAEAHAVEPKHATSASKPHATKATPKKAKTPSGKTKASKLVLRAATPGEAWVASGEHADDLRSVRIGDTLPGVGTIKSIDQVGGAWVVKGSKGSLR